MDEMVDVTPYPLQFQDGEVITMNDNRTGQSVRFVVVDSVKLGDMPETVRLTVRVAADGE
jgi:hypothetical protein